METKIYDDHTTYFSNAEYLQREPVYTDIKVVKQTYSNPEQYHSHDDIEFILILEGKGSLVINGVSHKLLPFSMVHLLPYHIHKIQPDPGEKIKIYSCRFSLGTLMSFSISRRLQDKDKYIFEFGSPIVGLNGEDAANVRNNFARIEEEQRNGEKMYEVISLAVLMQINGIFQRHCLRNLDENASTIRGLAWNILQYLQIHFAANIDSGVIARKFAIEIPIVNKSLIMLTGENFTKNLHRTRIRNACAMMLFDDLSIQYIGRYVGYKNMATFYRQFKKIKGITPDGFRKNQTPEKISSPTHFSYMIILYIFDNFRESINVESASKELYISTNKIEDFLLKNYNSTFFQLLSAIRIQFACSLLKATSFSISNIAYSVGFTSLRTFNRCFKEKTGTTATRYRELEEKNC